MLKIELVDFIRSDCKLLSPSVVCLTALYELTNGVPCRECSHNRSCHTLNNFKLKDKQRKSGQKMFVGKTNQQIADEMGISKRQVSKMRRKGEL